MEFIPSLAVWNQGDIQTNENNKKKKKEEKKITHAQIPMYNSLRM